MGLIIEKKRGLQTSCCEFFFPGVVLTYLISDDDDGSRLCSRTDGEGSMRQIATTITLGGGMGRFNFFQHREGGFEEVEFSHGVVGIVSDG